MADAMDLMNCSICLDLLKYPVAIPCGHNYCMGCIEDCWNQGDLNGVYSCPDCRKTFTLRPVLNKNTLLIELVEKLKNTRLHAASASHCYAEPGDVECDFCIGRKLKSVKFCLVCLASYCETHLQPHYEVAPLKKHKLVKASTQLHEMICSHHDKLLEVYCRTDQQCICYLCTVDEHKGHDTVSAAAERTEKQKQLDEKQQILKQRIQKTEMGVLGARQSIQFIKSSAQAAVEDSERIFPELIRSIERRSSEVKQLIKAKEMAEVSRTEGHLKQLEEEVVELRRKDAELEQLSHTEDHIHFLKSFQSFSVPPGIEGLLSTFNPHVSIEDVKKSLSELQDRMENVFNEEMVKISRKAPSHAEADSEVEVVYVRQPTVEQALLAKELLLPLTFFCYQNEPGYTSDDQTDDEDFETAVKALNGILYQDPPEREAASAGSAGQAEEGVEGLDPEVEVLWEKRPTPEEEQKARNLQLPSTFFCGVGSDNEAEKDKPEDFETEFRKAQEALDAE